MSRLAIQVVDLGFGDSGKGTMVDHLVRRHGAELVVRFNGGPQAGHNVVLPDGRHHTFAQFGSGSFVPGVRTLLSRFMVIEPYAMLNEARRLDSLGVHDALQRTCIDECCLVITPPHQVANRLRARAAGAAGHGTCGAGFGECVCADIEHPASSLRAGDFFNAPLVRRKLQDALEQKRIALEPLMALATPDERRVLDDPGWIEVAIEAGRTLTRQAQIIPSEAASALVRDAATTIFEGAQGVLLDERYGFQPHTTWSTTTFSNADTLLNESESPAARRRIGVLRTYMTRHGAGPFPVHRPSLDRSVPEPHNSNDGWQGVFRRGLLDLALLRYSLAICNGVDGLALTHLDRLHLLPPFASDGYIIDGTKMQDLPITPGPSLARMEQLGQQVASAIPVERPMPKQMDSWLLSIEEQLQTSVAYTSTGPTTHCKQLRSGQIA